MEIHFQIANIYIFKDLFSTLKHRCKLEKKTTILSMFWYLFKIHKSGNFSS